MARPAEEVLEFDQLRELLRRRTTCAPGRRHVDGLEPRGKREVPESAFALIREAREWRRVGRELGFGALADPVGWMERLERPGTVLEAADFLDAGSLLETAAWLRQQFREEAPKFPLLAGRTATLADFKDLQAAIRRCILPNAQVSDDASNGLRKIRASIKETRDSIQKVLKQILRVRQAEAGEDYVTLRNDRFARSTGEAPKAWCTERARPGRRYLSSRSKRWRATTSWCSLRKTRSRKFSGF